MALSALRIGEHGEPFVRTSIGSNVKPIKELLRKDARTRVPALSKNFPCVWNDPRTAPLERKRMIALLIEDVTLLNAERHVRFRGGKLARDPYRDLVR